MRGALTLLSAIIVAGCALLAPASIKWHVRLEPVVVAAASRDILAVSYEITALNANPPSKVSYVFAAVWAPPAFAAHLSTPEYAPTVSKFQPLSPGHRWVLVTGMSSDGLGPQRSLTGTGGVALDSNWGSALARKCVLGLAWQDASGAWWLQRFAAGGRALDAPHRIQDPTT